MCCVCCFIYLFSVSACEKKAAASNKKKERICSQEYARKDGMNNKKDTTIRYIFVVSLFLYYLQQNKKEIFKLQAQIARNIPIWFISLLY